MRQKHFSDVMSVRLPPELRTELEVEAHHRETSVAELIRERLDVARLAYTVVQQIRDEVTYFIGKALGTPLSPPTDQRPLHNVEALQVEMLLLLRQFARAGQLHDAQNSVHRLGLTVWTGEEVR